MLVRIQPGPSDEYTSVNGLLRLSTFGWPASKPALPFAAIGIHCAGIAQQDRASDYESEGRKFESYYSRQWHHMKNTVTIAS